MTVTVPLPHKLSLNKIYGGIHYHTRRKHRDEYLIAVQACRPKRYTGTFPAQITYIFQYRGRRLDSSNAAYMAKLLEDGLVHCGVIPDDAPKYIKRTILETDTGENEVIITISPCGE